MFRIRGFFNHVSPLKFVQGFVTGYFVEQAVSYLQPNANDTLLSNVMVTLCNMLLNYNPNDFNGFFSEMMGTAIGYVFHRNLRVNQILESFDQNPILVYPKPFKP